MSTVTVSPGAEATTTLTVRNDGDIVEAYTLEVVGDCAAWSTVEPARVSLYPGTSEVVTVRLAPPRSHEVRAGETPLGVRVLPAERPESVAVPEALVVVEPFHELRAQLEPRRRRGWLGARFQAAVQNKGNTPVDVALTGTQAGEELRLAFSPGQRRLEPGESADMRLRVRTRKPIWFGKPTTWPFEVEAAERAQPGSDGERPDGPETSDGEFVQLPVLPQWLLIVLAALLALVLAWLTLFRPAVKNTAEQAAAKAVQKERAGGGQQGADSTGGSGDPSGGQGPAANPSRSAGPGDSATGGPGSTTGAGGQQISETIDVQTGAGTENHGSYKVPRGKVFNATDIVVANFQGDEGVLTITLGNRTITTIALETFRNQDYHWVTPIQVPENATVKATVTCAKPGTPATGTQASKCHQVLNVSGTLKDLAP
ncbi:hydrolytic protein [Streptomyces sp. NPDC056061]|uniref:COG1470 family protein n=1 Tax=Streptomyces sp. NPDC056061 TaxID=3345700 RepID=UPI0035DFCC1A